MSSKHAVLTAVLPQVEKVAKEVASHWPGVIDSDDLVQELSIQILTEFSDDALWRLKAAEFGEQRAVLRRMANRTASEYRSAYEVFTGNYRYGTDEVRDLLNQGSLVHADLLTATERADITVAMEEISAKHKETLIRRYLEEDKTVDKYTLSRAVRSLTEQMNRNHDNDRTWYYTGRPQKGPADVEHL